MIKKIETKKGVVVLIKNDKNNAVHIRTIVANGEKKEKVKNFSDKESRNLYYEKFCNSKAISVCCWELKKK